MFLFSIRIFKQNISLPLFDSTLVSIRDFFQKGFFFFMFLDILTDTI